MTEREEMVERVATAILHRRVQEDYHKVDDHGAWVIDHDKELARAAIAECEKGRAELDAQCAAMRAGLEALRIWCEKEGVKLGAVDGYDYHSGAEFAYRRTCVEIDRVCAALSLDAGRKVLDVVRAAQKVAWAKEKREVLEAIIALQNALSALGWKP